MTTLNLNLIEKIFLSYEKHRSDKMELFLKEYHSDIDSKFLNKDSTVNFLTFKLIATNESDICLTEFIKYDEEGTPAFKCSKSRAGIDYILQGTYNGYYICFIVKTRKYMRFFARFLENTFL
jgi:hypothetical protein